MIMSTAATTNNAAAIKHGDLQFPSRCGFVAVSGGWEAIQPVALKGYSTYRDSCPDWSCPAGTVIRRHAAGGPSDFSRWGIVSWGDGSVSPEAHAEIERLAAAKAAEDEYKRAWFARRAADADTLNALRPAARWAVLLDCGHRVGYPHSARLTREAINASLRRLLGAGAPHLGNCPRMGHVSGGWWDRPIAYRHQCGD